MTTTLAILAFVAAINPGRSSSAAPLLPARRRTASNVFGVAILVGVTTAATLSGPIVGALGVSDPNARIAAGIGLLVVGAHALFSAAPDAEPSLSGPLAGLVPLAFPLWLNPAAVALAVAVGAEAGVARCVLAALPAVVIAGVAVRLGPRRWSSMVDRWSGPAGTVLGVVIVLDGVRSI